jgi:hypothetical protein
MIVVLVVAVYAVSIEKLQARLNYLIDEQCALVGKLWKL